MKKGIIILFIFSLLFFVGCKIKQVLPSDDLVDEDSEEIVLPDEIKNINKDDLVAMTGFHSIISSYIFHSTNEDLLKYVLDLCLSIKYSEILTDENRDPVAMNHDKGISIQLTNNRLLHLTLTTESNVYLQYFEKVGGEFVVKYQFKAYKPEQYNALTVFCQMGMPQNHWWCETPACTKYCTGDYPIDEYMQETIVKTFIDHKSPLSNFYKNGTKFSGFIRKSFGKFNGYYAVIVDGCGLCYYDAFTDVIVDGVKFTYSDSNQMYLICVGGVLSLQEAFEKEIISHDDLVEISKRLNKSYDEKLVIDGTYNGKVCYVNPGLSSIRVDMVFEISNVKLSINDKKYEIEEYEFDEDFFDSIVIALSYSLDYRQMFELPNKGWFALLESSETRKSGYSILISKFNTIYIFETVFDLEKSTCHILAGYELTKLSNYTSDSVNSIIGEIDSYDVAWTTWNTMGTIRNIKIDYLKNIDDFQALLREKCIEDNSPVENRKEAYLNFAKEDGSTYGCHIVAILDYDGNYHLKIYTNQSSKKYTIESRELSNKIGDLIFGLSGISKTPTYNFTNDCVLVVVKKEYSEINKVWNLDFFGDLPIKEVKDLTHRDNPDSVSNTSEFKQILKIVLKEPSYEGVLELIEELKKIDEFESAEPNYIGTWD